MGNRKLIPTLTIAVTLSACGLGHEEDKALGLEARMNNIAACMKVHSVRIQAGLGPLAVSQGGPDAEELIAAMRETAKELPDDHAQLPETYTAIADLLHGVSGKGIEAAAALADSPGYAEKVAKLTAWHNANCQAANQSDGR